MVGEALALRVSHPHAPAVGVLDLVIRGRGLWLEDFFEHLLPPSPFALLVAEAVSDFSPPSESRALTGPNADAPVREAMLASYR
ncbi:MAG TPA: hypothetical protein VFU71_22300 [Burkholderiaceae bacterium]|nr:hypothetical protein [Burkholderiaceae bacterium]